MAVEPQVQQFIDFIRDEMPRRIKTNPNSLPDAEKLLVSVSGTLEVIYKTLAELDIARKSDVDAELSNKEPTITAGSSTQYIRGDKTLATLNADAVPETVSRVYLSPEQKTVATQAASSSQSGYLTSADWSTFNSKKSLPEVKSASFTAEINKVYSLGTPTDTLNIQFPTGTVTGQEIITHINRAALTYTVNAVPAAGQHVAYVGAGTYQIYSGFCDHILRWVFNSSNSAWELLELVPAGSITAVIAFCSSTNILSRLKLNLPTATGTYNWYIPAKNINFGDLPNVATTDSNNLSGTRNRILGGSNTTVDGTDNIAVGCTSTSLASAGVGNYAEFCRSLTLTSNNKNCRFTGLRNDYGTPLTFSLGGDVEYVSYTGWLNSILVGARLPKGYRCVGGYRNSPTISGFASWNTSVASVETLLYGVSDGTAVSLTCADDTANAPQSPVPSIGYHCVIHELDLSAVSSGTGMFVGRRLIKQIFQGGSVTTTVDTVGTDATAGGFTISLAADSSSTVNGVYTLSIAVKNTANTSKVIWQGRLRSLVHRNDYTI